MVKIIDNLKRILITSALVAGVASLGGCSLTDKNEYVQQACKSIEALEYDEALEFLNQAEANDEDERLIYRAQGIAYLGKGDTGRAITALEKSLALSEGIVYKIDIDINYYLATAYYKSGNAQEALKIYDTIIGLEPGEVSAYYLRGVLYAKQDELEKAQADFNKAISLEPTDYDMLIKIYQILADNGYSEVATGYLKNALESDNKRMSDYEKGQISFYLGDYESAKTYLEKAIDTVGEPAALFLGRTYEFLGDTNYAISVYSSYINSGDASAEIINQMGICKMNMSDYEGALSAFQQAMKAENCTIMQSLKFNEIVAYEHLGDFEKAKVLMNSYLRVYPDDQTAKRESSFLQTR